VKTRLQKIRLGDSPFKFTFGAGQVISKDVMLKGKSRARAQGRFLQPPDKSEAPAAILEDEAEQIKKLPKRHASVYDAVAGGPLISLPSIV
jgi:hypothetical protein